MKAIRLFFRCRVWHVMMVALWVTQWSVLGQGIEDRIDSLRAVTESVPVVVDGDTLFRIYANQGGLTPLMRAENAEGAILKVGKTLNLTGDTLYVVNGLFLTDIMFGKTVLFSITDQDALFAEVTREELATQFHVPIKAKLAKLQSAYGIKQTLRQIGLCLLLFIVQYGLFWLTNYIFRKIRVWIEGVKQTKLKSIFFREYEILNIDRQGQLLFFAARLLKWAMIIVQLIFSVPMLFAIFPQTKDLAEKLFSYILNPVKTIFWSVINYIPNVFMIAIIYLCVRYLVKAIRFFANEIAQGKLTINGFYADWAMPSFNIIRFLLYAFMVAMIYQYLPYSDSTIFQGISVFVGLIFSFGSSTVIGNIMAGFVLTYMRVFKIGDRIKLNDTVGNVIEKTPFVTRIRTPKNEIITIPNASVMSSLTTNYTTAAQQYGLIIHTDASFGYEIPRDEVEAMLIKAALMTPRIKSEPAPFVLETELRESYPVYQINAYTTEVNFLPRIYSDLNRNIHDLANEAGWEMLLPLYYAQRDGNPLAFPPEFMPKPASDKVTAGAGSSAAVAAVEVKHS